jgi:hypothetical protein
MPCIWGQHNGSQLILTVAILPAGGSGSAAFTPGTLYTGPTSLVSALVDTGATTSGITSALAAQLQLQPVGKVSIHGVAGVQHHNSYLFMVGFPFVIVPGSPLAASVPPAGPGHVQTQIFVLHKTIQGCEFAGGAANFAVILGMDVLSTGTLVVQGNNTFSFSF